MKIIKLSVIKNNSSKEQYYTLFELKIENNTEKNKLLLLNTIRRNLIKETINNALFFIKDHRKANNYYYPISEDITIEEINESIPEIISNLKKINLKTKKEINKNNINIACIEVEKNDEIKANNIRLPNNNISILNKEQYLFKKISNKIKLRVIIEIKVKILKYKHRIIK
uniref:RNA polymerase subunit alpha n=1 Tax=Strombomonas costata TaxID=161230 RepID=UPI0023AAC3E7|nr:RNA polymerase subunit alpha [Strombomonas costata]WCH63615.1 RNA polymerase subunit alpha [Strombomonas costata]